MNPCLMDWERYTDGVIFEGDSIIIPYPPPKDPNDPLAEEVLISKSFTLPRKVTLEMEVKKEQVSIGLPREKWYEFASFISNNIVTWKGREAGFRFPLNLQPTAFSCFVQHPILWESIITEKEDLSPIEGRIKYEVEFNKLFLDLYSINFSISKLGWFSIQHTIWAWLSNNPYQLVFVSHNWSETLEAQHLYLKIHDVIIEE